MPALAVQGTALEATPSTGLATQSADGHAWYVSPDGHNDESTAGTLDDPFATISYAVSKMEGGDTVFVRGGTYRDEITYVPSGSEGRPSTICAYNGEEVWMTGSDLVTGWKQTAENGNIWVADMDWDMRDITEYDEIGGAADKTSEGGSYYASSAYYENLVFAGGNVAPEGRWPNAKVDEFLDRDHYGLADWASSDSIVDDALPGDVDFTGAEVWVASGGGYESQTATVTGVVPGENKITMKANARGGSWMYNPRGGNYYYITKSLSTLDAPGEWYKDKEAGKLYLYEPAGVDPNELGVEAQKRAHVIRIGYGKDARGNVTHEEASHITMSGINVRLGAVSFSPKASCCTFERSTVDCPDHCVSSQAYGVASGIRVSGSDNLVARCEVKHAYGSAITLFGSRNRVVNNHIHDTGYEHHEYEPAISITGREHLVSHNSVHRCMRSAITGFFEACVISYNDLYDCMRVSQDGGVVYFNYHDFENTEFHHNWLHDTENCPADQQQVGLYLDSFTTSVEVYRNVVWGIQAYEEGNRSVNNNHRHLTYQINPNSLNNLFANNTFLNYCPTHMNFYPNQDMSGTVFLNNIFQSMSFIDGKSYYPWRWVDARDPDTHTSYRADRDELADVGALFDRDHNMEGEFINNTWPPIDNQWKDPAAGDYTLAEGSAAIDAGCQIAGITDGYSGEAPDLGAYEYGQDAWTPGCDLARDVEETYALNEEIPYRNMLANRGFEKWSPDAAGQPAGAAATDFDGWEESGTPQVSTTIGAWGGWGWVSKQGYRCVVLDSDGDALTQHVSGLKKNATYRLGGYGFVAGRYVRPSDLTGAENGSGAVSDADLVSLRRKDSVALGGFTKLEFGGVDFGEGRNRVVIGLNKPKVYKDENQQVISVAVGSPDNVVGSYTMTEQLSQAEISWRWVTIDLGGTYTGPQDVYLLLSGYFAGTAISGFFPDSTASSDVLSLTASAPDAAQPGKVTISDWFKPFEGAYYAPHAGIVKTGDSGELDVTLAKRGSDLVAYADELFLSELPAGENFGNAKACSHVFKKQETEPVWEWRTVAGGYRKAFLKLTCEECGEEVEVQPSLVKKEDAKTESSSASFDVVGATYRSAETFTIPYYQVSIADNITHGTVSTDVSSAKRGSTVNVSAQPEDGYALKRLGYKAANGKTDNDITRTGRLSMPPDDITVTARFEPAFSVKTVPDQTYTGAPIEPTIVVLFGDKMLVEGVDYTYEITDNVEIGTATVTATGKGAYEGTATSQFKIVPKDISVAEVSGLATETYTGKPLTPVPTVKLDGIELKAGIDYKVSYKGNTQVGTATVTIEGMGTYAGVRTAEFKIAKRANTMVVKTRSKTLKAKALAKSKRVVELFTVRKAEGAVTYKKKSGSKHLTVNKKTGKVTVKKRTAKGTYKMKVSISAAGDANYLAKTEGVNAKVVVR